jgi:hypothetical protein
MASTRKLPLVSAALVLLASGIALAQTTPDQPSTGPGQMQQMMKSGQHPMRPGEMQEMMRQGADAGMHADAATPTMPGQDTFGAIQEIVQILDADPKTDWSKVDLEALRQHLIDMNEVTLRADAAPKQIDGGLEIAVTGSGRTLVAIQRMIPAWVKMAKGIGGWSAEAVPLPNGELLTVTATSPKETQHIRGLGFIGLLVSGSWHQPHHLAMARGEFAHEQ